MVIEILRLMKFVLYSLSAPPSWFVASMNRWWSSGVHFSLGLASVDNTKCMLWFCMFCRSICYLWRSYNLLTGKGLKNRCLLILLAMHQYVPAIVLFITWSWLCCSVISLHIRKHKWGYVGGIYAMRCGSSSLIPVHTNFFFFLKKKFPLFFLLWLEWGGENLWCSNNRESKTAQFWVLKGEKRGKVCGLFLSCCFPTSQSPSMVDSLLN